jgi:hypothetical protein
MQKKQLRNSMPELMEQCEKLLDFAPPQMVDNYAKRHLAQELKKFQNTKGEPLADVTYKVDGKPFSSLLDALYEIESWKELEIRFYHPNLEIIWEYDTPTKIIKINAAGKGALMIFPIDPFSLSQWDPSQEPKIEPAMFSGYLTHFYSPESIKSQGNKVDEKPLIPPKPLCSPHELWQDIRKKGIVPFQLTLCAYSKEKRYIYQLDVLNNKFLMDFRNGKIPIANRKYRNSLDYYHLDHFLSTMELPDLAKKVLQIIFELENVEVADIEIGLGITEKMAINNVSALAKRGILDTIGKPPKAKYVINLNNMKELSDSLP